MASLLRPVHVAWLLAFTIACHVNRAPDTVNELAVHFWHHYQAEPAVIAEAIDALHLAAKGEKLRGGLQSKGALSDLPKTELAGIAVEGDPDPGKARGFFVFTNLKCTLDEAERLLISENQRDVHPGIYDEYHRDFTSDVGAYVSRAQSTLGWSAHFKVTIVGASYIADAVQHLRFIAPTKITGDRPFLLSRTFQVRPADFAGDNSYDQDYEIEVFYSLDDGTVMHFYGIWRDIRIGVFSIEDDVTLSIVIDQLAAWDQRASDVCKLGQVP